MMSSSRSARALTRARLRRAAPTLSACTIQSEGAAVAAARAGSATVTGAAATHSNASAINIEPTE